MADGSSFSLGKMTVDEKTGKSKINAKVMGIDVGEIVEAQVKAKEIPLKKKQEIIDRQTKVLAAFSDFQAKIAAVKDVVSKLSNLSAFSGAESSFGAKRANASSSNGSSYTGYVAFTVAPSAKTQNFDIEICTLAKADKVIASQSSTSDLTASLSISGSLNLSSTDNEACEILITDDMNLQSIQDAINAVSDTTKVRASIIRVGDRDYRLNLAHIETGRKITLSDSGGVLDSLHIAESGKTDQDLSAHVKFNGVSTYHRNNIITDLVEGVTIEPIGVSPENVISVTVEPDLNTAKIDIINLVKTYNDFVDFILEQRKRNADNAYAEDAYLARNGLLDTMSMSLQSTLFGSSVGVGEGDLQGLMAIGVKVDEGNLENFLDEGKSLINHLKIDDALLDSQLLNNFDEVRRVFAFEARSSNTRFFVTSHSDQISPMVAGKIFSITLLRTGDDYSVSFTLDGQSHAGTVQEIEGNFRILGNAGTPFEGVVMAYAGQAISDGVSVSSNVLMTQGIADRLNTYLNSALTPVKGAFAVEKEDLKSEQENLQEQLSNLTERFEREKEAIIYRFSRLQSSLVALEALMKNITTYMGAIASNK